MYLNRHPRYRWRLLLGRRLRPESVVRKGDKRGSITNTGWRDVPPRDVGKTVREIFKDTGKYYVYVHPAK
jgi:hypothetical protein